MLDAHAHVMQVKLCKANTQGVTLVGVRGCVAIDAGHSLVTLLSLSVSVKDRSLQWMLGKSQIYYPKHILVSGRLEDLLLSYRGSGSFRTDC